MTDPLKNKTAWKLVGEFSVDTGLCWIGDPCYIMHTTEYKDGQDVPAPLPESLGKDWGEFCNTLGEDYPTMRSYPHHGTGDKGQLGVVVSTGFGDGVYPVYALIGRENRVSAIFVDFMGLLDDADEND